jgi:hypothetical protein
MSALLAAAAAAGLAEGAVDAAMDADEPRAALLGLIVRAAAPPVPTAGDPPTGDAPAKGSAAKGGGPRRLAASNVEETNQKVPKQRTKRSVPNSRWFRPADDEIGTGAALQHTECSLPRVAYEDLKPGELESKFLDARQPVIVTGAGKHWVASKLWPKKDKFLEKFGAVKLRTAPAQDITIWYGANEGSSTEESISAFVGRFANTTGERSAADFAFVFDTDGEGKKALESDWESPKLFRSVSGSKIFSIGDHDTGLPFHNHGESSPLPRAALSGVACSAHSVSCTQICVDEKVAQKVTKLAQQLGQLRPLIAVFPLYPQECMTQRPYFGPT